MLKLTSDELVIELSPWCYTPLNCITINTSSTATVHFIHIWTFSLMLFDEPNKTFFLDDTNQDLGVNICIAPQWGTCRCVCVCWLSVCTESKWRNAIAISWSTHNPLILPSWSWVNGEALQFRLWFFDSRGWCTAPPVKPHPLHPPLDYSCLPSPVCEEELPRRICIVRGGELMPEAHSGLGVEEHHWCRFILWSVCCDLPFMKAKK